MTGHESVTLCHVLIVLLHHGTKCTSKVKDKLMSVSLEYPVWLYGGAHRLMETCQKDPKASLKGAPLAKL